MTDLFFSVLFYLEHISCVSQSHSEKVLFICQQGNLLNIILIFFFHGILLELHVQRPWRYLKCIAPSPGCFLNSVHLVPLLTRSCRWSKSWLGPVADESGLAQDSVALGGP